MTMRSDSWTDLSEFLAKCPLRVTAPYRIDCGSSTDHRLMGLLCRRGFAATFNAALAIRTTVLLGSYVPGKVAVQTNRRPSIVARFPELDFGTDLRLMTAVLTHFRVHGLSVSFDSEIPQRSGLGGSAALVVALVTALSETLAALNKDRKATRPQIVRLAYNIEDALFDNCGLQDQAAAVYGGANLWTWKFDHELTFTRRRVQCSLRSLEAHTAIAYTGVPHALSTRGSMFLSRFREQLRTSVIEEISANAEQFVAGIETGDYEKAAMALREETRLRQRILPGFLSGKARQLFEASVRCGCGAKTAGSGASVWAVGPADAMKLLRAEWARLLGRGRENLLDHKFSSHGVESSSPLTTE
jgi:D-glycero-alpha-D-manno-heptose-7-phosphate kinase